MNCLLLINFGWIICTRDFIYNHFQRGYMYK